ncbi:MAG: NAD(P)/FAD-dependent oxidoreductase, partial [Proteobacteria bacterium]|nr:NAD(P)/FAD-dependent oxidoreductase [Pseudomonadota bacterium]
VTQVEPQAKQIRTTAGIVDYDYLVLATGSRHAYFGNNHWERFAPGLKTLEQATEIRRRVLLAFERAEHSAHPEQRSEFLTFVIVGGGPTGVELAGAIGEMAHKTLRKEFKHIDPATARIILLEGGDRILAGFDKALMDRAIRDLETLGVEVRLNNMVTDIREDGVRAGDDDWIPARTVLWGAGVSPSELGRQLGTECDRSGRVKVNRDLGVPGHPEIFVAGDLAHFEQDGSPLPGVAGVALQQGKFIGTAIAREVSGKPRGSFRYRDRGSMATIGHNKAVAQIGRLRFAGYPAWIAWVFVHIYYLSGFRNRVFVMLQWAWVYFTNRRNMRLILGKNWRFYPDDNGRPGDNGRQNSGE